MRVEKGGSLLGLAAMAIELSETAADWVFVCVCGAGGSLWWVVGVCDWTYGWDCWTQGVAVDSDS